MNELQEDQVETIEIDQSNEQFKEQQLKPKITTFNQAIDLLEDLKQFVIEQTPDIYKEFVNFEQQMYSLHLINLKEKKQSKITDFFHN